MKTYSKQPAIKYGFTDCNGKVWPDWSVDQYNEYTGCINNTANIPIKAGSLSQQERDFFLDQRHKFFVTVANL